MIYIANRSSGHNVNRRYNEFFPFLNPLTRSTCTNYIIDGRLLHRLTEFYKLLYSKFRNYLLSITTKVDLVVRRRIFRCSHLNALLYLLLLTITSSHLYVVFVQNVPAAEQKLLSY